MRIDAHHHFWEIGRYDYVWMGPELKILLRNYGSEELRPLLVEQRIGRTVLVQTISSVLETRWFLELARRHSFIAGVVGWVDLTDPAVGRVLDELSQDPLLVGIRHQVHDESDNEWLLREDVLRGLKEIARTGLCYDLLIRPQHLSVSAEVARLVPELTFIVDHLAKPDIAHRDFDDWAAGISDLAKRPNVSCKLSGMITEADLQTWKPGDLRPYIDHALQAFGPDRLMFGSDWPVCLLAGSYARVVEALEENLQGLNVNPSDQSKMFGENAKRIYRL